eukprot:GILI01000815.1.p2 GENE.GILI01000815.1~~GILI01000815.1.p2  ORF type:complete len:1124 (+),score=399.86 GILI01000815.1:165-3536(+)
MTNTTVHVKEVNSFPSNLNREALSTLATRYMQRSKHEEIDEVVSWGGMEEVAAGLKSSLIEGLAVSEEKEAFASRRQVYGDNKKIEKPMTSWFSYAWDAFGDFTLRVLAVSSIISIIFGTAFDPEHASYGWIEGFAIFFAVMVVICVTATNDYQKERQFRELNAVRQNKEISVIRGGQKVVRFVQDINVGDVVILETGDEVPADGVLIEGFNMKLDESSMTGETDALAKIPISDCLRKISESDGSGTGESNDHHSFPSPMLLGGTKVMDGTGKMLVTAVGSFTYIGKTVELAEQDEEATPLQLKLERIAQDVGKIGLVCAIIVVVVLYIRFAVQMGECNNSCFNRNEHPKELVRYLIIGVTVVVVAIPEGLPLAVTLSLAYSVKKMLKEKNLVRRLQACETMGGANNICSDKTGTLTTNRMTVKQFWNGDNIKDYTVNDPSPADFSPAVVEIFSQAVSINSTAFLEMVTSNDGQSITNHVGSKTECALLQMTKDLKTDYDAIRVKLPVEHRFPFSSARKRMSTLVKDCPAPGKHRLFVKGASEIVLRLCSSYINSNGDKQPLTEQMKKDTETNVIEEFAAKALRTICIAYRDFDSTQDWDAVGADGQPVCETELVCIGIAGIQDPLRKEVPGAVKQCQTAGIKVRMVTGDNIITAKAIARQCHIFNPEEGGLAMEGPEFYRRCGGVICKSCKTEICDCARDSKTAKAKNKNLRVDTIKNAEEFDKIWPNLEVLARSRPEDKYCLVTGLIERGQVVAVTGDGTNDAPALKKADVGFAMGLTGTEVAKEAAAIILMDDNFKSIVVACKWGRNVYDNIRRFLQFQLTVNVVAVVSAVIGALTVQDSPLSAIQLLWVNLLMDTCASLALATEPPSDALLARPPHSRKEYIVSKVMMRNILGQAVYQLIVVFVMFYSGETWLPEYNTSKDALFNPGTSYVISGRFRTVKNEPDYSRFEKTFGPSRMGTYVFNTFVLMQLFNEINARKLGNEMNILEGIRDCPLFGYIWVVTMGVQILLVEFGNIAFNCHRDGLTWQQWLICVAFGTGSLFIGVLLKICLPSSLFPEAGHKAVNPDISIDNRGALAVRRSSRSLARLSSGHVKKQSHSSKKLGNSYLEGSNKLAVPPSH